MRKIYFNCHSLIFVVYSDRLPKSNGNFSTRPMTYIQQKHCLPICLCVLLEQCSSYRHPLPFVHPHIPHLQLNHKLNHRFVFLAGIRPQYIRIFDLYTCHSNTLQCVSFNFEMFPLASNSKHKKKILRYKYPPDYCFKQFSVLRTRR